MRRAADLVNAKILYCTEYGDVVDDTGIETSIVGTGIPDHTLPVRARLRWRRAVGLPGDTTTYISMTSIADGVTTTDTDPTSWTDDPAIPLTTIRLGSLSGSSGFFGFIARLLVKTAPGRL